MPISSHSPNPPFLTNITLQLENKDLQFQAKEGVQKAVVNMYGTRHLHGSGASSTCSKTRSRWIRPAELLAEISKRSSIYQKPIPLAPGMYRLNLVVRDVVGRQHEQLRARVERAPV
jgi:hypothetical protein